MRFFFIMVVIIAYLGLFYQLLLDSESNQIGWGIADWLINYEDGGFKRRGLFGSMLFKIQDLTGLSLQTQVLTVQLLSYSSFILILFLQFKKKSTNAIHWGLVMSPFMLFFPICVFLGSGRKEILLILLFYLYAFLPKKIIYDWLFLFLYLLNIFFHELSFFYLPFLCWIYYIKNQRKINFLYYMTTLLSSVLIITIIYFFGGDINQGQSISILQERGVYLGTSNIFTEEFVHDFNHVLKYKLSFFVHFLEFLIVLFQLYYYVWKFENKKMKEYAIFGGICLLWMLPLFYLAIDWFRWIYIFFCLFVMVIIFNLDKNTHEKNYETEKIKIWTLLITPFTMLLFYFHMNHDQILERIHLILN